MYLSGNLIPLVISPCFKDVCSSEVTGTESFSSDLDISSLITVYYIITLATLLLFETLITPTMYIWFKFHHIHVTCIYYHDYILMKFSLFNLFYLTSLI